MPLPSLQTTRLILRNWTLDDVEDAFAIYGDVEVMRFLGSGQPHPDLQYEKNAVSALIERSREWNDMFGSWALEEKTTGRVIGAALLKPLPGVRDIEIGWHLGRRYWGAGFATEAAQALITYGFDQLKLPVIFAVLQAANSASRAVTMRLGMTFVGLTKDYYDRELELYRLDR